MNIGDRVRFLHGTDEGVVKKIVDSKTVEVDIEEGFQVPALIKELVVVSPKESSFFSSEAENNDRVIEKVSKTVARHGLFTALIERRDGNWEWALINNSDMKSLFSILVRNGDQQKGIKAGMLAAKSYEVIEDLNRHSIESWPTYEVQIIRFYEGYHIPVPPLAVTIRFKKQDITRKKTVAPLLDTEAYVISLDQPDKGNIQHQKIDPLKLAESMYEKEDVIIKEFTGYGDQIEIDLHWESLPEDWKSKNHLDDQLRYFEYMLDQAILKGMQTINFIHGNGNGILRNEIQKRLSRHQHVKYYEDTNKDKFGYGATRAALR